MFYRRKKERFDDWRSLVGVLTSRGVVYSLIIVARLEESAFVRKFLRDHDTKNRINSGKRIDG